MMRFEKASGSAMLPTYTVTLGLSESLIQPARCLADM